MDLNRAATFVKVVQLGSFTAAAKALGLPKSSVSRAVAALEADLGVRLLQRTTRQLHLTDAGRDYVERASGALATLEEAAACVSERGDAPRGRVRMTAAKDADVLLAPLLARFVQRHPLVQVDVLLTSRRVDLVEEGVDLALRGGVLEDSSLVARKVVDSELGLFASPQYLRRAGRPRALADLARHAFVLYRTDLGRATLKLRGPAGEEAVEVHGRLSADESGFLVAAAAAGAGVVLVPTHLAAPGLASGALERVLPAYALHAGAHLVVPPGRHVPTRVALLRDFLAAELKPLFAPQAAPPTAPARKGRARP